MKKRSTIRRLLLPTMAMAATTGAVWANAVHVGKVKRLPAPNRDLIAFEISWQNSWNVVGPPSNHDAVWVFVKFRPCTTGGDGRTPCCKPRARRRLTKTARSIRFTP
ncbi:MAG: hypothetical protein RMM53_08950, partial [Bacteroidia bacterium]|nr:hypothetical protein [Bacteroidia bacterium]MDW8334328.1 hypothetical protein [Bacteroidia bacterium]